MNTADAGGRKNVSGVKCLRMYMCMAYDMHEFPRAMAARIDPAHVEPWEANGGGGLLEKRKSLSSVMRSLARWLAPWRALNPRPCDGPVGHKEKIKTKQKAMKWGSIWETRGEG